MHSATRAEQTVEPTGMSEEQQLVVFQLGAELYGVEISRVHEIIRLQSITRVPRAPAFVEGAISCERCHGPGKAHIARMTVPARDAPRQIVNPAKLDARRRDSVFSTWTVCTSRCAWAHPAPT